MTCKNCGSYAINHHCHGRDGSDSHLCDVCYWRARVEQRNARIKQYEDMLRDITAENERLRSVEAAAENLLKVKGRHHTVEAYLRLEEAMKCQS
jgi:hypothetical protein